MKKAWLFLLSVLLLAGCGKSEKKWKIGVSIPSATHGWTGGIVWNAQQTKARIEKENPDVKVILATSETTAAQVTALEALLMQNVDALVVLSQEPEPLQKVCAQAKKKGIFLVNVSNPLPNQVQDIFVNGDNSSFGSAAGEAMGQALKGKGDIVVMEGFLCPISTERVNSFKAVLKKKYPQIRILEVQPTDWNPGKGLKVMEGYLRKYRKIDGVWAGDDDVLGGVLTAYRESKRTDVKVMVGGGGGKAIVKRVMDGDSVVKATVTYPPQMIAVGMEKALEGLRLDKKVPGGKKEILVPSEIVTRENAKKYYFPDSPY